MIDLISNARESGIFTVTFPRFMLSKFAGMRDSHLLIPAVVRSSRIRMRLEIGLFFRIRGIDINSLNRR
ncbi:hypothetical protein [Paenibacillus wynnii]|uniref:hypothetical protein n=1 Tax=Paenibacillus wynnii TaxID=268407 RepID=UPI00278E4AF0|nr:hypothetical protein [Paenibacillus wynnii]MDQ0195786.1 hypothetical protein [Paenibacillus wynnii]